jgi:hypothetical protein
LLTTSGAIDYSTHNNEDKLISEGEQKKKGLVKFIPLRSQLEELMREEGHITDFISKFDEKRVNSEGIPSEVA